MARATQGAKVPLDPAVKQTTPRWVLLVSVVIAWLGAGATAFLMERVGVGIDLIHVGTRPATSDYVLMLALVLLAGVSAAGGALFSVWAESDAERKLRQLVVSRIFGVGVARTSGRSGSLFSLATDGVERTAHYRAGFLGPIIGSMSTPLLVLSIMALWVDGVTAAWLTLLIVLVPILIGGFQRLVSPVGSAYQRSQRRLTEVFLESIQALDTLVYARAAKRAAARLAEHGEEHRSRTMRLLAGNQLLILVLDAAFSLTMVAAGTVIAATRVSTGHLSVGGAISVVLLTVLLVGPVDQVGKFFYIGIGGRASQRAISAQLRTPPPTPPAVTGQPVVEGVAGSIVVTGVTAGWPDGPDVLRDLALHVEPGERVALVGPSGIGKSTVSALLQAQIYPRAGRVIVDGLDTSMVDPDVVRGRLAVVEQRTFLFIGTIADNLRVAAREASDDELWSALDLAGLKKEVEDMPLGLATPVGEHGALLSGGQAQRLAIARAALRDAPVLLLDEPTSQVDLAAEAAILEALDRLAAGRTVLMIAHRPHAILAADRVIALSLDPQEALA